MRAAESGVDRASRRPSSWDDRAKRATLHAATAPAQLRLALIAQPSGVAVFWPASGHAVGILIISGWRAYPACLIRFAIGTVAANLLSAILTATFEGIKGA